MSDCPLQAGIGTRRGSGSEWRRGTGGDGVGARGCCFPHTVTWAYWTGLLLDPLCLRPTCRPGFPRAVPSQPRPNYSLLSTHFLFSTFFLTASHADGNVTTCKTPKSTHPFVGASDLLVFAIQILDLRPGTTIVSYQALSSFPHLFISLLGIQSMTKLKPQDVQSSII